MPKIKQYNSEVEAAGPIASRPFTDSGYGSGLETLGKGIDVAGDAIGKRAEQSDVSDLHASFSKAHADFTNNLAETVRTAQPGTDIVDKYMQGYDDYMSKLSDNVQTSGGRDFFTKQSAELRAHFLEKATAAQADLAGLKAKADYTSSLNSLSSSLITDPGSFDQVKQMHDQGIDELVKTHGLSTDVATELKIKGENELAKSAVKGMININPEYAKQQLASGRFDKSFNGDVKEQLIGESNMAIRANATEEERIKRKNEEALKQQNMEVENQFVDKWTKGELSTKDILSSTLDAHRKEHYIDLIKAENEKPIKTDSRVMADLYRRIHLPDGDPEKIVDEKDLDGYVINRKLGKDDLLFLRNETQGGRTPEGAQVVQFKKQLFDLATDKLGARPDKLTGIVDPQGQKNLMDFTKYFNQQFQEGRKKGIPSTELLGDTKSKNWLGNGISQFARTPEEIFRDMGAKYTPKPGETITQSNNPEDVSLLEGLLKGITPTTITKKPKVEAPFQEPTKPSVSHPSNPKARLPGETPQAWRERTGRK